MNRPQLTWFSAGLDDVPNGSDWMDSALQMRLRRMRYAKRHSEAMLGRWAAKNAIAMTLDMSTDTTALSTITVRNAADGAPEADVDGSPIDAVIAMTDRADWAVCMVLRGGGRVGCDLELVEPRSPTFVRDYFTTAERRTVARGANADLFANTIWSAKESALKVLRTGLRRDTRTVEVSLGGQRTGMWHTLSVANQDGRTFPGWWARFDDFVLTCAAEMPTTEPVSLQTPPALANATPTHRWMDSFLRP